MKFMAGLAIFLLATAACANKRVGASNANSEASRSHTLLFVLPSSADPLRYGYITIGQEKKLFRDPKIGQLLTQYRDGHPASRVRISRLKADPADGCTDLDQISFDRKIDLGKGGFVSSFEVNPENGFRARLPQPAELATLSKLAEKAILSSRDVAYDNYALLLATLKAPPVPSGDTGNLLRIFTDKAGSEVAVMTATASHFPETQHAGNSSGSLESFIGVFEHATGKAWQLRRSHIHSGCADCESSPNSYEFLDYGDFDQDGRMDLLFSRSAYETWDYFVLWQTATGWEEEDVAGGGC